MREGHNDAGTGQPASAIDRLVKTRDPAEVEHLADQLADRAVAEHWTDAARASLVEALLRCLTGDSIRQDADAEDALCSALAHVGVMSRIDNLVFEFVPERDLSPSDLMAVRRYRDWLPGKYCTG